MHVEVTYSKSNEENKITGDLKVISSLFENKREEFMATMAVIYDSVIVDNRILERIEFMD